MFMKNSIINGYVEKVLFIEVDIKWKKWYILYYGVYFFKKFDKI